MLIALCLVGCEGINRDTKIVLTTGFTKDEVFRIETASCYKKEVMVYLTNLQNQYEQVYGTEIWQQGQGGVTIEQSVKESVLAEIAQIKTMNLMADKYGLTLSDAEQESVEEAAEVYFDSLTGAERDQLDVTLDTIRQLYREYALADKVYDYIIKDINPEISDDEARTVTLQQIFVRTETKDRAGNITPYTEQQKSYAYATVVEALRRWKPGKILTWWRAGIMRRRKAPFLSERAIWQQHVRRRRLNSAMMPDEEFASARFMLRTGVVPEVPLPTASCIMAAACSCN